MGNVAETTIGAGNRTALILGKIIVKRLKETAGFAMILDNHQNQNTSHFPSGAMKRCLRFRNVLAFLLPNFATPMLISVAFNFILVFDELYLDV